LFASDAGLADRLLVVRLERRAGATAESALFDEIREHRNAGLSWLCATLAAALADKQPVPGGLNRRHPDFAALAVRIGRAIGREQEAIAALQAAESDKSLFNLQNDDLGATLLAFMQGRQDGFRGTADALRTALKESGAGFDDCFWTTKRIGRRLEKIWPHLEATLQAKKVKDRDKFSIYSFRAADIADIQRPFSENSHERDLLETFTKTALQYPQTPQIPTEEPTFDMKNNGKPADTALFHAGRFAGLMAQARELGADVGEWEAE